MIVVYRIQNSFRKRIFEKGNSFGSFDSSLFQVCQTERSLMNRLFSANKSGIICLCDRKRPGISTKSSASLFFCLLLLHITSSEIFEGRTSFRKPLFNEGRVYRRSIRSVASSTNCVWPDVDALFILDSTLNISPFDHAQERNFLEKVSRKSLTVIKLSCDYILLAC